MFSRNVGSNEGVPEAEPTFNPFPSLLVFPPLGEDLLKPRDFESRLRKSASTFELVGPFSRARIHESLSLFISLRLKMPRVDALRSRKFETRVIISDAEDERKGKRGKRMELRVTLHGRREGGGRNERRGGRRVWLAAESAH